MPSTKKPQARPSPRSSPRPSPQLSPWQREVVQAAGIDLGRIDWNMILDLLEGLLAVIRTRLRTP